MNITDEQREAAVERLKTFDVSLTDQVAHVIVDIVARGFGTDQAAPHKVPLDPEMLAELADRYRAAMEIATGIAAQARQGGMDAMSAQGIVATTYLSIIGFVVPQ